MDGAADVAETTYTPFRDEPDAAPVRLIVRRVKPMPSSQLALFATLQLSRLHHRPGRGDPGTGGRPPPPRRDRERHPRPQVRRGVESSPLGPLRRQRRLSGGPGDGPQPGPLDGAARPGRADRNHQDPPATLLLPVRWRLTRSARRLTLHLPRRWPWETQFSRALARLQAIPFPA